MYVRTQMRTHTRHTSRSWRRFDVSREIAGIRAHQKLQERAPSVKRANRAVARCSLNTSFVERRVIDRLLVESETFHGQFVSPKGSRDRLVDTHCDVLSKTSVRTHGLCRRHPNPKACRTIGRSDENWCKLGTEIISKFPRAERGVFSRNAYFLEAD